MATEQSEVGVGDGISEHVLVLEQGNSHASRLVPMRAALTEAYRQSIAVEVIMRARALCPSMYSAF
jgi:hypothetical protein